MVLRRLIIALLLVLPAIGLGQTVDDAIEQWLGEGVSEEAAAELSDQLTQWRLEPFNLNDTSALEAMPLLTHRQRIGLRNYIALYGPLLSLAELPLVPGFDSTSAAELEPYVTAATVDDGQAMRLWEGHHTLVSGLGGTVEQAAGYGNGHYVGDNLKALLCYTYTYRNHLSIRLAADKDPGEAWGKANYYGYHVMLSDIGRLERLVVGRYNLQFGQGLTLWTGLRPFTYLGGSTMRSASGVRQAGVFYEENYQEGVAGTVRLGRHVHLSAFVSEVEGESLAGTHAEWRRGNLRAGVTATYTALRDSVDVRDYVYNVNLFRGSGLFDAGVDAMWQWRHLTLYGEASLDGEGHPAALGGVTATSPSGNSLGISLRHYDKSYHNLHAQGYAIGTTQNEQGLTLDAGLRLPWRLRTLLSVDVHRFPSLRYGNYSPSSGSWLRAQLERSWGSGLSITVRYAYREKERNVPNDSSIPYVSEATVRQQLQAEVRGETGPWRFTARALAATFESEHGQLQQGWLVGGSARYASRRLQATVGAAWFDVDGYYARLYLSESNLQYAWSMPALYGRGLRGHLLLRYAIGHHLTVAARYALTFQPGQETLGSGDSSTEGPLRQTWHIQLRLKF